MGYIDTLSSQQKENVSIIVKACKLTGITNDMSIAGILSVVSKESGFVPKYEGTYRNTSIERIREIFSTTMKSLSDGQIRLLKSNDEKFFNFIYGGRYGNAPNEGFKYRGGGFNQLTFKSSYKMYGDLIGVDLVNHPEKINDVFVASQVLVEYFKKRFKDNIEIVKERYFTDDINNFTNLIYSAQAFYNANAGFKKNTINSKMDGYKKALDRVQPLYDFIIKK